MAASAPFSVKVERSPAAPGELLQAGAIAVMQEAFSCPASAPSRHRPLLLTIQWLLTPSSAVWLFGHWAMPQGSQSPNVPDRFSASHPAEESLGITFFPLPP